MLINLTRKLFDFYLCKKDGQIRILMNSSQYRACKSLSLTSL